MLTSKFCADGKAITKFNYQKNLEHRIDDAIYEHNINCRRNKQFNLMFSYARVTSSIKSSCHYHVYLDNNSPNSLVVTTWHSKEDWRWIEFDILTNDERFEKFVRPLAAKYVDEMYTLYSTFEEKEKNLC